MEEVILVDVNDRDIGTAEKLEAHQKGLLHRAFSIFVFNDAQELLIHQRALDKYHSGGLWTNTCCSHPKPGEEVLDAAHRRLQEEMGFDCELSFVDSLTYNFDVNDGLIEHELDHLFIGHYMDSIQPNPKEVMNWKFISTAALQKDMKQHPENYTLWFLKALPLVLEKI